MVYLRCRSLKKIFEERRAKNQCFYCDQKFFRGHKCSGQMYSLEVLPNEEEVFYDTEEFVDTNEVQEIPNEANPYCWN